jgi:hypothetical protein
MFHVVYCKETLMKKMLIYAALGAVARWFITKAEARKQLQDESKRLDKALDESFPASDPPAQAAPK